MAEPSKIKTISLSRKHQVLRMGRMGITRISIKTNLFGDWSFLDVHTAEQQFFDKLLDYGRKWLE
jgi:hypothetical protein